MKQLLILSGKGGTGKTTVASAFIKLSNAKVYADCDVDAPNLHLVLAQGEAPRINDYYGLAKAEIDPNKCEGCGKCESYCKFDAVKFYSGVYFINKIECEGCGVCEMLCPTKAISLKPVVAGRLMLYADKNKVFSTAKLKMGSGTSGMLVSDVKKQMREAAFEDAEIAIIDGSPGIGCPVIASMSGADMVLVVAEPSISGISDLERVLDTASKFQTRTAVCINKYDTNMEMTERIKKYCKQYEIPFVGKISYDNNAVKAINKGVSIVDIDCVSGSEVKNVYKKTIELLFDDSKNA